MTTTPTTRLTIDVLFADLTQIPHGKRFLATLHPATSYIPMASFPVTHLNIQQALNETYRATQNVNETWRPSAPCRSSAVGDLFIVRGASEFRIPAFLVDSLGFKHVDLPTAFLTALDMQKANPTTDPQSRT